MPFAFRRSRLAARITTPPPVASTMSVRSHELGERRFLAIAEDRLALDLEDRRDRDAEPPLELGVGVDEGVPSRRASCAPERRLARAGQSDQKQIAAMQVAPQHCSGFADRERRADVVTPEPAATTQRPWIPAYAGMTRLSPIAARLRLLLSDSRVT